MNGLTRYIIAAVVVGGAVSFHSRISAGEEPVKIGWSIAIHGGAGGDPSTWSEEKVQARKRGLERALRTGRDMLADGGQAIDVVQAAIQVLEDDAVFNAGRGAVLTEDGRAELDASIMDGSTLACGAVAGVTRVKNPIGLARRVMTETKHVLLAGPGADEFAVEQQVPLVDPDYFLSRIKPRPPRRDGISDEPHFGTVGCVVLDSSGDLAAGTSTGGTSKKLPGRVGDSPIVGAGTYAANDTCAVSGTGIGEEYIRHSVAYDVAAQMRYSQQSMSGAISEILTTKLDPGVGGLIAVSHRGDIVMQHNTPGMSCGAADDSGRFEIHLQIAADAKSKDDVDTQEVVDALLREQVADWNRGDIDAFMKPYWQSDELAFSSGGTTTRGYEATLARYKRRYPSKEKMGFLSFDDLEYLALAPDAMQVLGTWKLTPVGAGDVGGRFTLVLRRFSDGWKIIHDHTSALASTKD